METNMKKYQQTLHRVIVGPEISKRKVNRALLKATSELLLDPRLTKKSAKAWGLFLAQYVKRKHN